jgi:nitroimidazol reductase NimA-like FMN-containing flavoprotein (pyridoxamine 5'-phosphate oxidase superfamily)
MQPKMINNQLTESEIVKILKETSVGHLATVNADNNPYVIPIHFVYFDGAIFLHGRGQGFKIDNINHNPNVSFEVEKLDGFSYGESSCKTSTTYQSVIVTGKAFIVSDMDLKIKALEETSYKYSPQFKEVVVDQKVLEATCVIKVEIKEWTGKFHL